jgi:hypothetical protein
VPASAIDQRDFASLDSDTGHQSALAEGFLFEDSCGPNETL